MRVSRGLLRNKDTFYVTFERNIVLLRFPSGSVVPHCYTSLRGSKRGLGLLPEHDAQVVPCQFLCPVSGLFFAEDCVLQLLLEGYQPFAGFPAVQYLPAAHGVQVFTYFRVQFAHVVFRYF